jgi:succinate-acetate transporter protein
MQFLLKPTQNNKLVRSWYTRRSNNQFVFYTSVIYILLCLGFMITSASLTHPPSWWVGLKSNGVGDSHSKCKARLSLPSLLSASKASSCLSTPHPPPLGIFTQTLTFVLLFFFFLVLDHVRKTSMGLEKNYTCKWIEHED